jgi:hypothetical protein
MNVLISDDGRSHWDSLRRLLDQETEIQLSGTATKAETASRSVIARELRRILDGCPICDDGYRDHAYALLATVEMEKSAHCRARLKEFYDLLQQYRWQEFLCLRDGNPGKDIVAGFAFRCTTGRVGIVTQSGGRRFARQSLALHDPSGARGEEPSDPPESAKVAATPIPSSSNPLVAIPAGLGRHFGTNLEPVENSS